MTEKRLYHRMKIEVPVCFERGNQKDLGMASTLDISATGLSFQLKEPLTIGETLRLTIGIDEDKSVKVQARVMWLKEKIVKDQKVYTAGLKVVDKMDQDEMEFVRFIARKMFEHFKRNERLGDDILLS